MSYNLNLGAWGSVFAVPTAVVDEHLKICSAWQLKVLLYLLKNNNQNVDENTISDALGMHPDDVKDSLNFWVERKVISFNDDQIIPAETEALKEDSVSAVTFSSSAEPVAKVKRAPSRPVRPETGYVVKRLGSDPSLAALMDEAQHILGRVISNSEAATLVMLHDTDGLPVDVIMMLLQFCADNNKCTMRYIEKIGIQWGSDGINTVSLAESEIRRATESYSCFNKVAASFGMKNVGSPTKKQLAFANQWVGTWSFSSDMLRFAYERCVDTKGELNMDYINGILKKWYMAGWKCPEDVKDSASQAPNAKPAKANKKSNKAPESAASYDIDAYEKKSIFD